MTIIAGACGPGAGDRLSFLLLPEDGEQQRAGLGVAHCAVGGGGTIWRDRDLLVVADARIDDRAALLRRLDLSESRQSAAQLVALAWRRWGEAAPDQLLGDYAFALFDKSSETLWLVRDALGFRPLCFTSQGAVGAFCSLPSRLAGDAGVSSLVAKHAIAARATPLTWFPGIEQVQPGEIVRLHSGAPARRSWWQPSTLPSFAGTREDLFAETSRALESAVADRVGDDKRIACHLSAGLDSMAVAVTTASQVETVTAITARPAPERRLVRPRGRLIDESAHAAEVVARYANMHHIVVDAGNRRIVDDLTDALSLFDQPLTNPTNFGWFAASCSAAQEIGAQRLLVAQSGNFSLSPEAGGFWWSLLRKEGVARFVGEWRRAAGWRVPLREIWRRAAKPRSEIRLAALRSLDPGAFLKGFERRGLQVLDPTADRRLIELALTVPENLLVKDGDRRCIARRLLRGRVPDHVLDEPRRGFQSADWLARLDNEAIALAGMLADAETLGGTSFADSSELLWRIAAGFDEALDGPSRARLAPDLAIAGFLLAGIGRR